METQKLGGIAALTGAATNLLGLGVFLALLEPKGVGNKDSDPTKIVALLADNEAAVRVWYQVIYLAFGVCLILLSLALYERLKAVSPMPAQAVTILGLIWAFLVIVIGTLSINDLNTVVNLYGKDPSQAGTVWLTLDSVETGLGGGGGETMVSSLWFLLFSWAALRAKDVSKLLSYLGVVIGVAGVLSVVLASLGLMAVYGLALIIWLAWLGIVMLRRGSSITATKSTPSAVVL